MNYAKCGKGKSTNANCILNTDTTLNIPVYFINEFTNNHLKMHKSCKKFI